MTAKTKTPPTAPAMTLEHLDPSTLIADANIRKDLRLTKQFVASIAERGVLVPLVCVRATDGVKIRYGHRRAFGAIEAGLPTVPCIVTGATTGTPAEVDRILAQYDENTHREGLTTAENAGVVAGLLDLGMTTEFIARQTQMHRDHVQAAQKVTRSKTATAAAGKYTFLTLDQAAGLAEFEDDTEALQRLTAAAEHNPEQFAHTLQRMRDDRDELHMLTAARTEAEAAGLTVLGQRPSWDHALRQLRGSDGKELTTDTHAACPGHAVYLEIGWDYTQPADGEDTGDDEDEGRYTRTVKQSAYCTDPKANGHKSPYGSSTRGASARTTEERREVIENNKLWRSAETVRRAWLREYLTRKTIPARALRFVLEAIAYGDPQLTACMNNYSGSHALATGILGLPEPEQHMYGETSAVLNAITGATDARAQVIALAIVLCAYESATDVQTWRKPTAQWATRYFTLLKDLGYGLADVEQLVLAAQETQ